MMYVPLDKRPKIDSLLKECEEHIQAVLGTSFHLQVVVRRAKMDEKLIREILCEKLNVEFPLLVSPTRVRKITTARMIYCYLLRSYLTMSYNEIGKLINRDHTSVIYLCKTVSDFLEVRDAEICYLINPIIKYLNSINEPIEI